MKKNIFLFIALTSGYATAMEQQKTHLLVIPGQNGMGGQNVDTVLPYFVKNNLKYLIPTPLQTPDFGQTNCQNHLKRTIKELKAVDSIHKNDPIIIHASSQGTATALNYVANNPQNIKGLILESVMLTGNSAIFHTVEKVILPQVTSTIEKLPSSSYYTLPYTAKSLYPSYSPSGEQPIINADKLPNDLPIIILHDTQDFQLSFKDAQGLYAFLTKIKKNKNVYLFAQESTHGEHINLLKKNNIKEISAITTILKLHNILPFDHETDLSNAMIDLSEYQPAPEQEWIDHFHAILSKEQNLESICSATTSTSNAISSCIVM